MTNEEVRTIAQEVANILSQNAPQKAADAPVVVTNADKVSESIETAKNDYRPTVSQEQMVEIMNDVRMESRAQFNQPWVDALRVLFKNPAAYATIGNVKTPLISANQVNAMIESLKANGKFWPAIVTTIINQDGNRQFINSSFKREPGNVWRLGGVVKPEDEAAKQ